MIRLQDDSCNEFRLARVLVSAFTRALENGIQGVETITCLWQHGGTLNVYYSRPPSDGLKGLFATAWAGENECAVEHEVER